MKNTKIEITKELLDLFRLYTQLLNIRNKIDSLLKNAYSTKGSGVLASEKGNEMVVLNTVKQFSYSKRINKKQTIVFGKRIIHLKQLKNDDRVDVLKSTDSES